MGARKTGLKEKKIKREGTGDSWEEGKSMPEEGRQRERDSGRERREGGRKRQRERQAG
jgi:hypothetical protein